MTKSELLKIAKPILFNTEMVRAILDGRKTVTRRIVKGLPINTLCCGEDEDGFFAEIGDKLPDKIKKLKPPYSPYDGDILYVRETWQYGYVETSDAENSTEAWFEELPLNYTGEYLKALSSFIYKVGNDWSDDEVMSTVKWRPSIHMPKEAARIFLRVTNVRVERLLRITNEDANHEGVQSTASSLYGGCAKLEGKNCPDKCNCFNAREIFIGLWDSLYAKIGYGWNANPWVWVIEFERIEVEE